MGGFGERRRPFIPAPLPVFVYVPMGLAGAASRVRLLWPVPRPGQPDLFAKLNGPSLSPKVSTSESARAISAPPPPPTHATITWSTTPRSDGAFPDTILFFFGILFSWLRNDFHTSAAQSHLHGTHHLQHHQHPPRCNTPENTPLGLQYCSRAWAPASPWADGGQCDTTAVSAGLSDHHLLVRQPLFGMKTLSNAHPLVSRCCWAPEGGGVQ